ncbi:MAG: elongation factor G [Chloroflexota bacterium]|nr:elongation factor G [Chloroflexota bacterium]
MRQYTPEQIRNVVLLSHSGAGKTSLAEAMLYGAGAITRLGKIDQGSSTSDYDPEEIKRKISVYLSLLPCEWQGDKVNIIDVPGYPDFVGEVKAGIRIADAAIFVVCVASGVEVGTELSWGYADERKLSRLIMVNKIDRENADFLKVVGDIRAKFGRHCLPITLPIGAQDKFEGVIDLISMKAYRQDKEGDVPDDLRAQAEEWREQLVESVAETDDELVSKYLEGEVLTEEELRRGLRAGTVQGNIVPILAGSAADNVAINSVLDAVCNYLPSPKDIGQIVATNVKSKQEESIASDPTGPLAALVFKTSADPYVGKLTYFRVYSGTIQSDSVVWNAAKETQERIGQLYMLRGKSQDPVSNTIAGDIGAVAKLAETTTGDALCGKERPLLLPGIEFPNPCMSASVHPKTKADLDKLGPSITRIAEEDPSLRVYRDSDTGETVISGMGEAHLDVVAEKMQRKFGVDILVQTPKIPYKETINKPSRSEYKHKKQTGGHGQYGHVLFELEPLPRGTGFEFENKVVGGSVPRNFIPAVEKGLAEGIPDGVLARYPVVDVKVILYDGSYHPVDSSEMAFKIAASMALKKGLTDGNPVLLEPVVKLKITVPDSFTGDIMGDLNSKRAKVLGMNPQGGWNIIEAHAPLAEVQRYAIDLRAVTQGRGVFEIDFSHYEEMPAHQAQKIIAAREAEKAEK